MQTPQKHPRSNGATGCDAARERWHQLHDAAPGNPRPHVDAALRDHLARCPACAAYAADMQALSVGLGALRRESQLARPPRRGASPRWRIGALSTGGIAAALLLALLLRLPEPVPRGAAESLANARRHAVAASVSPLGVELSGAAAARFLPIERQTSQPNVRVIELLPLVRAEESEIRDGRRPSDGFFVGGAVSLRSFTHATR